MLHINHDANSQTYGREVTSGELLGGSIRPPPEWRPLIGKLRALDLAADAAKVCLITCSKPALTKPRLLWTACCWAALLVLYLGLVLLALRGLSSQPKAGKGLHEGTLSIG